MEFVENRILELGPGVFIRNAVDNATWADLGEGVVVVDALEDPNLAPVIQNCIRAAVGKPMKWLINTHWHADHTACNPIWARQGVTVITHESVGPPTLPGDGRPDITFHDRYTLRPGERAVEVEYLGGTHTPWDSVVYFTWAKVLHVADLFGWGMIPLARWDEQKVPRLREVLGRVLAYDADVLIPGHGPVLTRNHIRRWLQYFEELLAQVPAMARARKSLAEVAAALPPPEDMRDWWRFVDWKHGYNLKMLWEAYR
ncbi:MAG: MBL fold metallo-hydrolase [Armatimonadetes bacterium]|nr:MBL fold metallo-hydrolase [Armatimonadota bacterium]